MTKTYEVEQLIHNLSRQYPTWPSTFSTCECKRHMARGGGKCADCLEVEIANIIKDELLAYRLHRAIKTVADLKGYALDAVRNMK